MKTQLLIMFLMLSRLAQGPVSERNVVTLPIEESFGVNLIAISVRNVDSTSAWYQKYLGFKLIQKMDVPQNKMRGVFLEREGFRLELVQHEESFSIGKFVQNLENPALLHGYGKVSYWVENVTEVAQLMKAGSVRFIVDLRAGRETETKTCIVLDNEGNWVQLKGRY